MNGVFVLEYKKGELEYLNGSKIIVAGYKEGSLYFISNTARLDTTITNLSSVDYIFDRNIDEISFIDKSVRNWINEINEKILKLNGHDV